jgi:chromosome segregation ATPase
MANENRIVSVEFDINKRIDGRLEEILNSQPVLLPADNHPLVEDYIRKIEGTYDVSRSKEDTDNAIDLLYIAYNTTPQEEGQIRVGIDSLMGRLIRTQQESELKMKAATEDTNRILKSLRTVFEDWQEIRSSEDATELKGFVGEDLFDLAGDIKTRAERISTDLANIANTYNGIIDDTSKATAQGEQALANRLKNKAEVEKEISKNNADREKLQSLVNDLQADIKKYEKLANEYKSQAETAEERAFIMSIVRVGAQMISAAIPAITAAATGGGSLIAGTALNTAKQLVNSETAQTENDTTAKVIETKKEISDKKAEKAQAEKEKTKLVERAKSLNDEKEKVEKSTELDESHKQTELTELTKRIDSNEKEIKEQDEKISAATRALNALQSALQALDKNMGQMSEKQEAHATDLRALQMKMLEKVEAYEQEKRNQAAELVKINALLKGQRTEEETIQLAIRSLNLSLAALKRVREIIIEVSFFFKSFADFMQQVMNAATEQSDLLQKVLEKDKLTPGFIKRLLRSTNDFFVTQTAEWTAVQVVATKFVGNFNEGWSRLNKLSGNYLTGDKLKAYLELAAGQIDDIAFKRKEAANAKLAELNQYRDRIKAKA